MTFVKIKTSTIFIGAPYDKDALKNKLSDGNELFINKDHVVSIKPFVYRTAIKEDDVIKETKHNLAKIALCNGESFILNETEYKKLMQ